MLYALSHVMCCPVLIIVEETSNSTTALTEVLEEVEIKEEMGDSFLPVPEEELIELPQKDKPFEGSPQVGMHVHVALLDIKSSCLNFNCCCLQFHGVFLVF